MGRLAIVEEGEGGGPGQIPEASNNNSEVAAASSAASASSIASTASMDPDNKRKAGNSDESGYLSEKDVDEEMSDDGSVEIVFERKGDKNGNRDGAATTASVIARSGKSDGSHLQQPPPPAASSSKRLKTEQQLRTLAEVVVASSSSSTAKSEGDSKGKTLGQSESTELRKSLSKSC